MILLIDNYDSFTYNLVQLVGEISSNIAVHRNDRVTTEDVASMAPTSIILSPGPCTPNEAGICLDLVRFADANHIPLFGVCLGHQSIAQSFGATISRASNLMHGKTSRITHTNDALFDQIPIEFTATRYHSLVVDPTTIKAPVVPIARAADDGELMAIRIDGKPIYGVQFHPESIASEFGDQLLRNFLNIAETTRRAA